jgi:hypothetical protein
LKWDEVTGGWRELHNEELRDLYSSPSIIRMMKSRRISRAEHVARIREKRNTYKLLWESQRERDHQEDQDVGGWIISWRDIWRGIDWISLAQDKDKWMAFVNAAMNLRVS